MAVAFLTRLPVPGGAASEAVDLGGPSMFFPLVGAGLGALAGELCGALRTAVPPSVLSILIVAFGALVTGALHLDGLADTADGLGGGRTPQDALRIMRDHAIGSYGAAALVLHLALKCAALAALIPAGGAATVLVVAGAASRWAPVPMAALLRYARAEGGLGSAITDHAGAVQVVVASILTGAVAYGIAGTLGLAWWAAVAAFALLAGLWFRRRLGGVTGDTLGAVVELAEVLVWILALVLPA